MYSISSEFGMKVRTDLTHLFRLHITLDRAEPNSGEIMRVLCSRLILTAWHRYKEKSKTNCRHKRKTITPSNVKKPSNQSVNMRHPKPKQKITANDPALGMLSPLAFSMIMRLLRIGCFVKIYPYSWDAKKCRLAPAKPSDLHFTKIYMALLGGVNLVHHIRFIQYLNADLPSRFRVMHVVWEIAVGFALVLILQFHFKRNQIMFFVNSLLEHIIKEGNKTTTGIKSKRKTTWVSNHLSEFVILVCFLVYVNPPAHAALILYTPCAPHYMSSLFLDCKSVMDFPPNAIVCVLRVFMVEFYIISLNVLLWAFNWAFVFLGMDWVNRVLNDNEGPRDIRYRKAQLIVTILNDGFKYYLLGIPIGFLTTIALLIFGTIRFVHVDLLAYLVYPICGLRCIIDSATIFSTAGHMSQQSYIYLEIWRKEIQSIEHKYQSKFLKSCQKLMCIAGSLYTFEKSILLISFNRCSEMTFNLLVTYN